jgi:hypothetical protein
MRSRNPSHIARTLTAAKNLGHEPTAHTMQTLSPAVIAGGTQFSTAGARENSICFLGPCDPQTNERLVGYLDENGNCNNFVKVPC